MRESIYSLGRAARGALVAPLLALGLLLGAVGDAAGQANALHTAVAIALETGDLGEVERLIASGTSVDARSGSGMTPLMVAAFSARPRIVQFFLDRGADPNATDGGGKSALLYALMFDDASKERTEIVRLLLAAGADPGRLPDGGAQVIALAEALGHDEAVKLLRSGSTVAAAPSKSATAVMAGPERWRSIHPQQAFNWRTTGVTCALSDESELYCWGLVTPDDSEPHRIGIYPERIGGGQRFASFHLGALACGVRPSGESYCWQGLGAVIPEVDLAATRRANEYVYRPVDKTRGPGPSDRVATGLVLDTLVGDWGGSLSCGLDASGRAYCWGAARSGQLGDGRVRQWSNEPQRVAGGMSYRAIGVGIEHACALDTEGVVYCWGANYYGQLGQGAVAEECGDLDGAADMFEWIRQAAAMEGKEIDFDAGLDKQLGSRPCKSRPAPVAAGGQRFSSMAVGAQHACAVGTDGAAYCWGSDQFGQVTGAASGEAVCETWPGGAEDVARYKIGCRLAPTRIPLPGPVRQVAAGELHSCALGVDGRVHCWGTMPRSAPSRRPPFPTCVGMYADIATPEGQDLFLCRIGPTLVESEAPLESIVAGAAHTCGLTRDGEAYCWGYNAFGQLGDGSSNDTNRAVRVRPGRMHSASARTGG